MQWLGRRQHRPERFGRNPTLFISLEYSEWLGCCGWSNHGSPLPLPIPFWDNGPGKIFTTNCGAKVGIGTDDPISLLNVDGQIHSKNISINTYDNAGRLTVRASSSDAVIFQDIDGETSFTADRNGKIIIGEGYFNQTLDRASLYLGDENHSISSVFGKGLILSTYGAEDALFIQEGSGKVGIGVSSDHVFGNGMLEVDGTIRARRVIAEQTSWPDYVFEENYERMTFSDLRNYVLHNKHLPGIPSANEIETEGLDLGEMLKLQMQKIEELTLYILELEERLNEKIGK